MPISYKKETKEKTLLEQSITWLVAFLIGGLLYKWWDWIFFGYHLPYWKFVILGTVHCLMHKFYPWTYKITGVLMVSSSVLTALYWVSIIKHFPLFKH